MKRHTCFTRYVLFQVPGWLLGAIVLLAIQHWLNLSQWATCTLLILWVVKDFVIYPFVRTAYESTVSTGAEQLVGATGTVEVELKPQGYVRVGGELWRAHGERGAQPIPKGQQIRVLAAQGLTLTVTTESTSAPVGGLLEDNN